MTKQHTETQSDACSAQRPICGLVMPIATFGDYSQSHWGAVEAILREALVDVGFDAKLVSQETASGVIHQRIITNLYTNEIVVCDVSARNPNVMFELGIRLAFDKPTIIVKDDETPFSFDISGIEHLTYPKALTYADIVRFKGKLGEVVLETTKLSKEDPSYSTFLKHVSGVKPARLDVQEIPFQDFIMKQLDEIRSKIDSIPIYPNVYAAIDNALYSSSNIRKSRYSIDVSGIDPEKVGLLGNYIAKSEQVSEFQHILTNNGEKFTFRMPLRARYITDITSEMEALGIEPGRFTEITNALAR